MIRGGIEIRRFDSRGGRPGIVIRWIDRRGGRMIRGGDRRRSLVGDFRFFGHGLRGVLFVVENVFKGDPVHASESRNIYVGSEKRANIYRVN
jgi:hypothetical protein